jgi:hypothetical protein
MSDERLRQLECRWRETGSVEDEAGYLLERVRVGDLERGKLELAADLGHPAAHVALSRPQAPRMVDTETLYGVAERHGDEATLRLGIACGAAALHVNGSEEGLNERGQFIETAQRTAEEWLVTGSQEQLALVLQFADRISDYYFQELDCFGFDNQADENLDGGLVASVVVAGGLYGIQSAHGARAGDGQYVMSAFDAFDYLEELGDSAGAFRRVREDLVPWALGYSDPVHERVEARLREATGE